MLKFILCVICSLAPLMAGNNYIDNNGIISSLMERKSTKELFKIYHFLFKKDYDLNSEIGIRKYKNFKQRVKQIKEVNSQNLSYKLGYNEFSDMSDEEFVELYTANSKFLKDQIYSLTLSNEDIQNNNESSLKLTQSSVIDWSSGMNEPRQQGACGDCWAFASTATIEHALKVQNKDNSYLSTQHLTDCVKDGVNPLGGCKGATIQAPFKFAQKYGILREKVYPFTSGTSGKHGTCNENKISAERVKIGGYETVLNGDINKWLQKLSQGPIMAMMYAPPILNSYVSGIWEPKECLEVNHAIVAVGYRYENNELILKIRNSWGPDWGQKGYFEIKYNQNNFTCSITKQAIRPYL
jgi:C1A family cysteine protease